MVTLCALGATVVTVGRAGAQAASESNFTIYVRSTAVGTEQVSVERSPDGITVTSTGRIGAPIDLLIRQYKARYDAAWKPLELTIDATLRGQASTLHTTVSGTTASTESIAAPGSEPVRRTDTIDAQALFLPNPFIAPYEAIAARAVGAPAGTTLFLYQPGQGSFTAVVGPAATERIQTIDRVIEVFPMLVEKARRLSPA